MNLWIRSQDKRRLLKPNHIFYTGGCLYDRDERDTTCLGSYERNERCHEILDEIQGIIIKGAAVIAGMSNDAVIYKMPEK